jgi:hypothetical protein
MCNPRTGDESLNTLAALLSQPNAIPTPRFDVFLALLCPRVMSIWVIRA